MYESVKRINLNEMGDSHLFAAYALRKFHTRSPPGIWASIWPRISNYFLYKDPKYKDIISSICLKISA